MLGDGEGRRCGLGTFAEFRGLRPIVTSHAMARTHIVSNPQASPIILAKSTAIGPKAMRNRNGFIRNVTAAPSP